MPDLNMRILLQAQDTASQVISGLGSSLSSLFSGNTSGAIAGVGLALTAVGTAAISAGIASVQAAADYQQTMLQVQALAGVSASDAQAASAAIMQMAVELGQSPKTLAEGLYYIASAGYSAKDSLILLELAAKAAAVGNTSTEITANALTAAMKAFNVPASQAASVMDIMTKTVSTGKLEFDTYAASIGKVSINAAQAGVSFLEANAAFATLSNVMPSAKQAADALNALLSTSSRFDVLTARAKSLGIEFDVNAYKSMNFEDRLKYLKEITGGNTEELGKLLGRQNALAAATILGTDNFANYDSALKSITNSAGALDAAYAKTSSGFNAALARMSAAVDVLMIAVGTALLPILTQLVNAVTPIIVAFTAWTISGNALSDMVSFLHNNIQIILPIAAFLATLIVDAIIPAIAAAVVAVWGYVTAMAAAAVETLIAMAPILLIAAAIAALVAVAIWLYQTFPQVRQAVADVWQAMQQLWQLLSSALSPILQQIGAFLAGVFIQAWNAIWQALVQVGSYLGGVFTQAWNAVRQEIVAIFPTLVQIGQQIIGLVQGIIQWAQQNNLLGNTLNALVSIGKVLWGGLVLIWQQIQNSLWPALVNLYQAFSPLINVIVQLAQYIAGNLIPVLSGIWNVIKFVAIAIAALVVGIVLVIAAIVKWLVQSGVLITIWNAVVAIIRIVIVVVGIVINILANTLAPVIASIVDVVRDSLIPAWNSIVGAMQSVWQIIKDMLIPVVQQLWITLQALWQQLAPVLIPVLIALGAIIAVVAGLILATIVIALGVFLGIIAGVLAALGQLIAGIIRIFAGIIQIIAGAFQVIAGIARVFIDIFTGNFSDLGAALGQIWQGIVTMFGGVWQVIQGIFQATIGVIIALIWNFISTIITFFTGLYNALIGHSIIPDMLNAIVAVFQWFVNLAISLWNGFMSFLTGLWNTISSIAQAAWNTLLSWLTSFIQLEITGIQILWNAFWAFLQALWNIISSVTQAVWNFLVSAVTGIIQGWIFLLVALFNGFMATLSGIWNMISGTASAVWNFIRSNVFSIVSGMVSSVVGVWNSLIGQASGIFNSVRNTITGILSGLAGMAWGWGRSLIDGFLNGVRSMIGNITGLFNYIWGLISSFFPHSPPKTGPGVDLPNWGPRLAGMFAEGIVSGIPQIEGAVNLALSPVAKFGSPALVSAPAGRGGSVVHHHYHNEIHVDARGSSKNDADAIANKVMSKLLRQFGPTTPGGTR
jgi:TP901 family phage tail tape measure protein